MPVPMKIRIANLPTPETMHEVLGDSRDEPPLEVVVRFLASLQVNGHYEADREQLAVVFFFLTAMVEEAARPKSDVYRKTRPPVVYDKRTIMQKAVDN
jgi:hypothetical protein